MSQSTYRMRRRVGGALLAGVAALGVSGVAAVAGGGIANAAAPSVSATVVSAPTISGNATTNGGTITLTVNGAIAVGDHIVLTIACPSTGAIAFTSVPAVTGFTGTTSTTSSSNCGFNGTNYNNVLTLVASAASSGTTPTTVSITPSYTTTGAPSGAVSISGTYQTIGAASVPFSVPSDATVNWFGVTSNVPATTLSGTSAQSVGNITITQPSGLSTLTGSAQTLKVVLSGGTFSTAPTLTSVPSSAITPTSVGSTLSQTTAANDTATTAAFTVNTSQATNFIIGGLSIIPAGSGQVTAAITYDAGAGNVALSVPVANYQGPSNRIYGQTADDTVAAEFEAAYPVTSNGNKNAVLATNVDPYDALSAAYLESQLGTGLLITSPTNFTGSAAAAAMKLEGVQTVYVVGGPDAITPAVISQIEATPAYNPGGVTTTGSNLKVVGPIYGQTADDTAQQIATYFGGAYGSLPAVPNAYNSSNGVYNDTTGNASATGPASSVPTAFVISDNDWRDATTLGPIAYAYRIPIILNPAGSTTLGTQASAALAALKPQQVIVVGGQLALNNSVVTAIQALNGGTSVLRIAGQDYTDTAVQLAKFELATSANGGLNWGAEANTPGYLVSHGDYWSDALGAAAIGGQTGSVSLNGKTMNHEPILTTENPTTPGTYLNNYLSSVAPSAAAVNVLGGPLAVTSTVVTGIQTSLAS